MSGTRAVCDEHTFGAAELGPDQGSLTWMAVPLIPSYFEKAMSQIRKFIERISQSFSVISTEKTPLEHLAGVTVLGVSTMGWIPSSEYCGHCCKMIDLLVRLGRRGLQLQPFSESHKG